MENIIGKGYPKCITVWQHLEHMKSTAQGLKQDEMKDFISDLRQTYTYLQKRSDRSKEAFKLKDSAIWLNLPSWDYNTVLLDDFKSS